MQIIKYSFTQICVYLIDLISFVLIYNYFDYSFIIANVSSKFIACIVAFFIHKFFTFNSKGKIIRELIKYFSFLPINIIIGTIFLGLLINLNIDYKLSKIISDIITFIISFVLAKKFIFNKTTNKDE